MKNDRLEELAQEDTEQYIYNLHFIDGDKKIVFYVGRTNNPARRKNEHKNAALYPDGRGNYPKYDIIRALNAENIPWELEVVARIPFGVWQGDYEKEWVIRYVLEGHTLMNMKHGDATKAEVDELNDMLAKGVRTAAEVKAYREEVENVKKANAAFKLAEKIRKEEEHRKKLAELSERQRKIDAYNALVAQRGEEERNRRLAAEAERKAIAAKREKAVEEARKLQKIEWDKQQLENLERRSQLNKEYELRKQQELEERKNFAEMQEWIANLHGLTYKK